MKRISRPVAEGFVCKQVRGRYFVWFFLIFFFLSCASARPALAVVDIQAASGLDWLPVYGEDGLPVEGLALFAAKSASPPLEFWAIRADLNNPHVRIVTGPEPVKTGRNSQNDAAGGVPSIKVSGFAREYGCIAAINANPFYPSSAVEGERRAVAGLAVSDGRLIAPPHPRYDALVFFSDGGAEILSQQSIPRERNILNAAGGFYQVLKNGVPTAEALSDRGKVRHPRSAAGLSADGGVLFLLVIDGRRSGSIGAAEEETALILKRLGAENGLCFDGGGSSALALRQNGRVSILNKPVHGGIPGTERAVAVCLGIAVQ